MALPSFTDDFPAWYQEVVRQADLAENSLVRGTMVIKPYGYALWEAIRDALDTRFKATGHQNLYFPMFIPLSLMEREKEHVEGFAHEFVQVTRVGSEELAEPLVVRPSSETIIWQTYAKWVQSYRDLPLLYNQWANIVRWELRPRLFLRTTEFLWQEGHTAHETADEAWAEAKQMLEVYRQVAEDEMAMPVYLGRKTPAERFPGAEETLTIEALMRDRKALQAGTSHYLGQNFAKAYGMQFLGRDGEQHYAEGTSWGATTRLVGGLIMTHGDESGLRLPPRVAPTHVLIVPIPGKSDDETASIASAAAKLAAELRDLRWSDGPVRVELDDRDDVRPGYKFAESELRGIPIRLELGFRDLQKDAVTFVRRDLGEKEQIAMGAAGSRVVEALGSIQRSLFDDALAFREAHTTHVRTFDELRAAIDDPGGFVFGGWCGDPACESKVKEETKATIRLLPLEGPDRPEGPCVVCAQAAVDTAAWAIAY
jgi:prolyl-tRNA synthetase